MMEESNSYQHMPTIRLGSDEEVVVSTGTETATSEGVNFWEDAGEKVKRASMTVRDSVTSATSNMVAKMQDLLKKEDDPNMSADDMADIRSASVQFAEPRESQLSGVMRRVSSAAVVVGANAQVGLQTGAANVEKAYKSIGESPAEVDESGKLDNIKGEETDYFVTMIFPAAVGLVALMCFVFGILAMISTASAVVDLACYCLYALAVLTLHQKMQLEGLGDFRGQQKTLRNSCNSLARQNNMLSATLHNLESQVTELGEVQAKMEEIAQNSGTTVDRLSELVEENEELQEEVIADLEKQVTQQIVTAIIRCDRDKDFCIGEDERHILFGRLRSLKGVNFNLENFLKLVDKDEGDLTLADVMELIRQLKDETVSAEDSVFTFDIRSMY